MIHFVMPQFGGETHKFWQFREWTLEIQKGTRMNADECRLGMVAQSVKVDGALWRLSSGPTGASRAPRRPLPVLIRVLMLSSAIGPVQNTDRFVRFTIKPLVLPEATDSK